MLNAEQQNHAILGAHPDLMFLQTTNGVYLQFYAKNPTHRLIRPELFLGRSMYDVLPTELADRFAATFKRLNSEEPAVLEYTLDIEGAPGRYEARFIGVAGDRVLSVVRDITERWKADAALRETQQRYALATAAGGVGVWDLNMQTGEIRIEGGLQAILGYRDAELGSKLADWERLIYPADRDEVLGHLTSYARGTSQTFEAEFRMLHKDGSVRWFIGKGAVTDRTDGTVTRITGTFVDTTDRNESARALKEANEALIRMGRIAAPAELSASIAHELHQPLTAIAANAKACLRWINSGVQSTDLRDALTDMVNDVHRASHIIERTHDMFTNQPVNRQAVHLNDVITDILETARGRARESNVTLEVRLDEQLPAVLADPVQIQQVLLNLIVNGVEAMQKSHVSSRVLRISSRRGRDIVVVSVRDTGEGFESRDVRRVFEPFFTTKAGGLGMGLAIGRSIIKSHGGSLWAVANVARAGATFRFTLPVFAEPAIASVVSSYGKKVLIVDDHAAVRKSMTRLIRTWGHTVEVAADCASALLQVDIFQPDFIVIDVSMHAMSGVDLARRLRETSLPSRPFLIALTASKGADMRDACLAAGFDAYLMKGAGLGEMERLLAS